MHTGLDHRLRHQEQVGRAGTGDGRQGVELAFGQLNADPDGLHHADHLGGLARGDGRAGCDPRHSPAHQGRGVRHDPDHRLPRGQRLGNPGQRHTGGDGDDESLRGQVGREISQCLRHAVRLDSHHHDVGSSGLREADGAHLVPVEKRRGALGVAVDGDDLLRRGSRSDPSGHERLAHGPGPDDSDHRTSSSAIWMAFSAAPLRRLSLLTNSTSPVPPSTLWSCRMRPT